MKNKKLCDYLWIIASIVICLAIWLLKDMEDTHLIGYHILPVRILVPGFALLTALYNFFAPGKRTWLITLALLFAAIAETINAMNLSFGLLFFAVTHTLLTIYHWRAAGPSNKIKINSGLVFAALYVVVVWAILANLHNPPLEYILVVPIYMIPLSIMAWRSVCTFGAKQSGRIILGSTLFYICDVLILAELTAPNFSNPPFPLLFLSWAAYLPALFLLSTIGKTTFDTPKHKSEWF